MPSSIVTKREDPHMTDAPKAIFFDLDDTILDFMSPAGPAWEESSRRFASEYEGIDAATVLASIHRVAGAWWADPERHRMGRLDLRTTRIRNAADALAELAIPDDGLSTRLAESFANLRTEGLRLFPGARQALEHFHSNNVAMALLTNGDGPGQRYKIDRFDLADFFDCILIEGEFGVGKPDERVFRHALTQLECTPEQTWMVGDNLQWEIEPCRRLGLHTVWVDFLAAGLPQDVDIKPHRIVNNINELIES